MPHLYYPVVQKIRDLFCMPEGFIPLHAPHFGGNEQQYVADTIKSTFVSSVGAYVNRFEEMMQAYTGARYAIATTNGTTALHLALVAAGIGPGDEVITQPLTFVATANAISHAGAIPVFVDVDRDTMGLSPVALEAFLAANTRQDYAGNCINQATGRRIKACLPMHTFGFPLRIDAIKEVCHRFGILLIEDAAESLGSFYKGMHTGRYGLLGTFSFNGNKTITCGGGGIIITDDGQLAKKLKHLSTTAKVPHAWAFFHDEVGYNYRLPNINAALACAQMEQLDNILHNKRQLAEAYRDFFALREEQLVTPIEHATANNWLNTIILNNRSERDQFLQYTNKQQVMTRPVWQLLNDLPMYSRLQCGDLSEARWLEDRVVNIPSSYRPSI